MPTLGQITSKLKKIDKGKPRRMTKKTPQESKVRKRPGFSKGGKVEMASLKPN